MEPADTPKQLAAAIKGEALRLGFNAVGIAPAVAPVGYAHFRDWLARGSAAGMDYLERHAEARSHPGAVLEGVRSIVQVAMIYAGVDSPPDDPVRGRVARYARGSDYHRLMWDRLDALLAWLHARCPEVRGRSVVDTAPLLERDFAQLAGLGWIGKNTMLIGRRTGSYTVLGALLIDAELLPDPPFSADHCGTCTRCLDACPTSAFDGAYRLNAGRCISYWTIEHRGAIPDDWADRLEGWVFGCDICQEVCPWNRKVAPAREPELAARPEWTDPDLIAWLERSEAEWTRMLSGTALRRAKRAGLVRNAALVLGTRRVGAARSALEKLRHDPDEGIRAAALWALGRLSDSND